MKKILGAIIGLVATCFMVGCVNNAIEGESTPIEVCFSPVIVSPTRADDGAYPTDNNFGVWAYALPDDMTWGADANSAQLIINGEGVTFDGSWWRTSECHMWESNTRFNFFAWSPFELAASYDKTKGVCFNNFDILNNPVKPMFTKPIVNMSQPAQSGVVSMPFHHALAQVGFRISTSYDVNVDVRIKSVKVGNLSYIGNFSSLPAPTWEQTADVADFEFCDAEFSVKHSTTSVGESRWVLPQHVTQSVVVTYDIYHADGSLMLADQVISSKPMDTVWTVGRLYIYSLTLKHGELVFNTETL